jgi:hypothetical protein
VTNRREASPGQRAKCKLASLCPSPWKGGGLKQPRYSIPEHPSEGKKKSNRQNRREAPFLVEGNGILASLAIPPQKEEILSLYQKRRVLRSRNCTPQLLSISYRDNLAILLERTLWET